ncbi:MAG: hypothetical protein JOY99_15845 [Sphingomonadaceae bacterium]|nr:hypothetical protein [Sphingomonadaceae bacterium]
MIVVKAELHSAVTGEITSLGTVVIDNVGGNRTRGNYRARAFRKGSDFIKGLLRGQQTREGSVTDPARLAEPVWSLIRKGLESMAF